MAPNPNLYAAEIEFFLRSLRHKKASDNTIQSYLRDIRRFALRMSSEGVGPGQVSPTALLRYLRLLEEDGMSAASRRRHVASLRAFFRCLRQANLIAADPAEGLKAPAAVAKPPEVKTVDEVARLLAAIIGDGPKQLRNRAMLETLYATGLRVSELLSLSRKDLQLTNGCLLCDGRVLPLGAPARNALSAYLAHIDEASETGPLFTNRQGDPLTRQGFWKIIRHYARQAGLADVSPHSLRHACAAHMLANGADAASVQALLGHASIVSTLAYQKGQSTGLKEVYEKSHPRASADKLPD